MEIYSAVLTEDWEQKCAEQAGRLTGWLSLYLVQLCCLWGLPRARRHSSSYHGVSPSCPDRPAWICTCCVHAPSPSPGCPAQRNTLPPIPPLPTSLLPSNAPALAILGSAQERLTDGLCRCTWVVASACVD